MSVTLALGTKGDPHILYLSDRKDVPTNTHFIYSRPQLEYLPHNWYIAYNNPTPCPT